MRTRWAVLYDGNCRICTSGAERLKELAGDKVDLRNFQDPKNLEGLPEIPFADLMDKMYVVSPDDGAKPARIYKGAAAIARVAALTPVVGPLALLYYVPGLRQLADFGYSQIAKRRYRLSGGECEGGTCKLHAHG
ncbi:MAG: thiol-disulfide oxidoreductase DCC family protein [Polyangiaceae bacterium]